MATRQINIFVEGNDDHELIVALLYELLPVRPDPTKLSKKSDHLPTSTYLLMGDAPNETILLVLTAGGWNGLSRKVEPFAKQAIRNLIIFDADTPKHADGGQVARRAKLTKDITPLDPNALLFLFPDNQRDGNLETLLLELIQPFHDRVMDCFDECLSKFTTETGERFYHTPYPKRRVYNYVNVLPLSEDERYRHEEGGGQKLFANPQWWNLQAKAIEPLRQFLRDHVQ